MPKQIGFGQKYGEYLDDLANVFTEVFRSTKSDGSLWIIVDTFRKGQEVLPLPFDLAARLKLVGWTLRDIIIWKKERTVPWTQHGATRKIFEYILVFSKGVNSFHYESDKYRETIDLKKWWVRYPERYSPKGKSLEEIWNYDIPTQGSWGQKYVRHFCPLPTELVSRIIQLTTNANDVVFDPFAGSGTVPTVSHLLGRSYIGIELNPEYVKMFKTHLSKEQKDRKNKPLLADNSVERETFANKIANLRILKYGRLLLQLLKKDISDKKIQIYIFRLPDDAETKFKPYAAEYKIYIDKSSSQENILEKIENYSSKAPFSKFGISPKFKIVKNNSQFTSGQKTLLYFQYTKTNSHCTFGNLKLNDAWKSDSEIFSPIKLEVNEPNE